VLLFLADLYKKRNTVEDDQIFEWLSGALKIADEIKAQDLLSKAYYNLHEYYRQKGNFQESLVQLEAHLSIERELHKNTINQKVLNLEISHKAEESRREADAVKQRNKELTELNAAIEEQKKKLETALAELKSAQAQLIHAEKMASLGELTAGIAHEIQNPLNFVNNFSEVSNELIEEMKQELATGNWQLATEIADDVKQNLQKINHHGKRADVIVKGMLQHSRTSSGQKELTDINALADEYLRMAFHGLRAKDKSFNANMKTDLDETIGKINVIPQDIGRVILNLINNAFYAVDEKKKQTLNGYEPTVLVSTKKNNGKVEIKVNDNGNGIPQKVVDKIFQPFFTTKPTGQGTGLGLSLSYDIVKAHGGELKVETKEGEGSQFLIQLNI
jgi:signal transduction histidine kinase